MLMEGWGEVFESTNTSGVSGVNSVAAKPNGIEVNGDRFFKRKKQQEKLLASDIEAKIMV